jgi:four helix bundle protein
MLRIGWAWRAVVRQLAVCRILWSMLAHERFEAWRTAHELALAVFRASDRWPRSELYVVTAQVRRAALSIPSNIAEGAARQGRREFARYLNIALGSLAELQYLLRFARDRGQCELSELAAIEALSDTVGKLLFGLYRRMRV